MSHAIIVALLKIATLHDRQNCELPRNLEELIYKNENSLCQNQLYQELKLLNRNG